MPALCYSLETKGRNPTARDVVSLRTLPTQTYFCVDSAMKKINKVVLAYSGGLDTSAMLLWLKETYGCEVVCYCADVGQGEELTGHEEKAKATGASKLYV